MRQDNSSIMINITKVVEKQQTIIFTHWECPRCKAELQTTGDPPTRDDDWSYCKKCQDVRHEERKAQWISNFKELHRHLIGATIVDVEPDCDYWWDFSPEDADAYKIKLSHTSNELPEGTVITIEPVESYLTIGYSYPDDS